MIQDKTIYIPRGYWQSALIAFRKAFALCLKVFKVIESEKHKNAFKDFYLVVDEKGKLKCTSCEQCMIICPSECLLVKGNKHLAHLDHLKINHDQCISCYLCQDICPEDALYLGVKRSEHDVKVTKKDHHAQ